MPSLGSTAEPAALSNGDEGAEVVEAEHRH